MSARKSSQSAGRIETRPEETRFHPEGWIRDLRFSFRQFLRRPGFTFAIVFTLAVGIGPNVAVFSVLKALLQPLPYPEPDRLVQVWETDIDGRWRQPFSYPDFLDIRDQNAVFEEFGVYTPRAYNIGGVEPERVRGVMGSAGVLRAYGISPVRGRLFTNEEEESDSRVVVLSDGLWRRRYDADPEIIGAQITIDGQFYEVIGVMPEEFDFLSPWTLGSQIELWTPLVVDRRNSRRDGHWLLAIGRLSSGLEWRTAEAQLRTIAARLQEEYPDSNARTQVWLNPFLIQLVGGMTGQLLVLLGAVGMVLLIACANVASMLLAKGADRETELAIRACFGARQGRLVGQLLTESILLSLLGGIGGVLFGYWSIGGLRGLIPPEVPRAAGIKLDGDVLAVSLTVALLAGLVFGLVPALTASRLNLVGALKEGTTTVAGRRTRNRLLRFLAAGQLAVAFMLTIGASLLFRSYQNVLETPQVFGTAEVLTASVALSDGNYALGEARVAFWEQLIGQIEALPGVERAAVTTKLPLEGGTNSWILVEGETYDPDRRGQLVEFSYVSPGYFEAMGIPLLVGRFHQRGDEVPAERIAVVNRALVDRYWPDADPIGQRIRSNSDPPEWSAVVAGVVDNVRQWGPEYPPLPEIYFPYSLNPWPDSKLVVHSGVEPFSLTPAIRSKVLELDKNLPLSSVRTMEQVLAEATEGRQFLLMLVSLFTVVALILAVTGIFGMMSYNVAQRRREIGVRVAFGAVKNRLIRMILWETLQLAGLGIAAGLFLTFVFAALIGSQLYGVSPLDLVHLSVGALFMATLTLAASTVPALKATRVDPIQTLKAE